MGRTIRGHEVLWRVVLTTGLFLGGLGLAQATANKGSAQAPTGTPTAPGTGGVTFGSVRVSAGNELPRNSGQENQPPVWITITTAGATAVVVIGNATKVPLDFTGTVVLNLAPDVTGTGVLVSTGSAVIQGSQLVWSGFTLSSGEIAPSIIQLASDGSTAQAAASSSAISSVDIEAKGTGSGVAVTEQAAGGGPAVTALPPRPTSTSKQALPSGSSDRGSTNALSVSTARTFGAWALALMIAMLAILAIIVWLVLRTGRRIERLVEAATIPSTLRVQVAGAFATVPGESDSASADGSSSSEETIAARPSVQEPAGRHRAWLNSQDGSEHGRDWPLEADEIRIGRNQRNEIVLDDPRVSEQHARLSRQGTGSYLLVDGGSTNGTRINGNLIREPVTLHDGDSLRFGSTTLVFRESAH